MITKFSLLMLGFALLDTCCCQSEGDLRLVNETSSYNNSDLYQFDIAGRLEIFWKGKWGTFCNINQIGSQIACSQMGYSSSAFSYQHYADIDNQTKKIIPKAGDDVPIVIERTFCGTDNLMHEPLHLLRCGYFADQAEFECTHDNDIVLHCSPTFNPISQVRLRSGPYPSSGTLEIYINNTWGNVCNTKFNQQAADSACRQMGYTNAKAYGSTKNMSSSTVWLDGIECSGSESCECLNICFKTPSIPTGCPSKDYISIECTFDVMKARNTTSGGWDLCQNINTCNGRTICTVPITLISGVAAGIAAVIVIFIILIACLAIPSCPLGSKQRRNYELMTNT